MNDTTYTTDNSRYALKSAFGYMFMSLCIILAASLPASSKGDEQWMSGFVSAGVYASGGLSVQLNGFAAHGDDVVCYGRFLYPSKCIASWNTQQKVWDTMHGGIWFSLPYSYTVGNTTTFYSGTEMRSAAVVGDSLYVFGDVRFVDGSRGIQPAIWDFKKRTWSFLHPEADSINLGLTNGFVRYNNQLLFSGYFYKNRKQMQSPLRWNGTTFVPFADSTVDNIHGNLSVFKGELYATSVFNDSSYGQFCRWNGSTWKPLIDSVMLGTRKSSMNIVATTATHIYIGGSFNQVRIHGDTIRPLKYLIRYDGTQWESLIDTIDQFISAVSIEDSILVACGSFSSINNIICSNVAEYNLKTKKWSSLASGFSVVGTYNSNSIRAVLISKNVVYVGGAFNSAGPVGATNVAAYDRASQRWQIMATGTANAVPGYLDQLYNVDEHLETFTEAPVIGSTLINKLARFNGKAWESVGTGLIGQTSAIRPPGKQGYMLFTTSLTQAVSGNTRYFSGAITHFAGEQVNGIFRLRNGVVEQLDSGLSVSSYDSGNFGVWMAAYAQCLLPLGQDSLIAAGDFAFAGSKNLKVNSIALWDGKEWQKIGSGVMRKDNSGVYTHGIIDDLIRDSQGNLYACGKFRIINDVNDVNGLAMWNGKTWLDPLWDAPQNFDSRFSQLYLYRDTLVVVGNDPNVNSFKGIATIYKVYDGKPHEIAAFVNDTSGIYTTALKGDSLIIGGSFRDIGGIRANGIACFNLRTNTWSSFGTGFRYGTDADSLVHVGDIEYVHPAVPSVSQILFVHDTMYVRGGFLYAGNTPSHGMAAWIPKSTVDVDDGATTDAARLTELEIQPNPAQDFVECHIGGLEGSDVQFSILDLVGRNMYTERLNLSVPHTSLHRISVGRLPTGSYQVILRSETRTLRASLIILR